MRAGARAVGGVACRLAAAHEQRRARPVELEIRPVERDQLGAAEAGLDEREHHEPVTRRETGALTARMLRGGEETRELGPGEPVSFLLWLRRRLELEKRVGHPAAAAQPSQEPAQEPEAAVVRRGAG